MKRILLALTTFLATFVLGGTADAGTCYDIEVDHPDGGPPMTATVCP